MIRDQRLRPKIGADYTVTRTIRGLPTAVVKAWLTIKAAMTDADPGLVQRVITTALDPTQGQITDDGADGTGTAVFLLLRADTALFVEGTKYYYDIQVKYSTGVIEPIEEGTVVASRRVTQASS